MSCSSNQQRQSLSWAFDLQLPVQWMPITTNVCVRMPTHGEVYSIQNYVIKIVSGLRKVDGWIFFRYSGFLYK
jgi:hypothetical protein